MTVQNVRLKIASPALKLRVAPRLSASIQGANVIGVTFSNGIWTASFNPGAEPLLQTVADPTNTYLLAWNAISGAFTNVQIGAVVSAGKVVKVLTAAGPYAALPTDDVLIIKQAVGAPFTVTVDWSARYKPLRVVDGKGDAAINNITITPAGGQTQLAQANYSYKIDGNGGSITLTPLPDNSGAY